jgi:hypothetical protein
MNLDGYVTVNQRLLMALADHPQLKVVEEMHEVQTIDDQTYLACAVWVYLTPDDERPIRGSVLEPIRPDRHPLKHSELMTGFTSALGRALGYLGYGIDRAIATSDEIDARRGPSEPVQAPQRLRTVQDTTEPSQRRSQPTEKMIGFYRKLCSERGLEPDEATMEDFDACKVAIDRLKQVRVD